MNKEEKKQFIKATQDEIDRAYKRATTYPIEALNEIFLLMCERDDYRDALEEFSTRYADGTYDIPNECKEILNEWKKKLNEKI